MSPKPRQSATSVQWRGAALVPELKWRNGKGTREDSLVPAGGRYGAHEGTWGGDEGGTFGAGGVLRPQVLVMVRSPQSDMEKKKDALLQDQSSLYDEKVPSR